MKVDIWNRKVGSDIKERGRGVKTSMVKGKLLRAFFMLTGRGDDSNKKQKARDTHETGLCTCEDIFYSSHSHGFCSKPEQGDFPLR